jgi:serine/threonine protein kinase
MLDEMIFCASDEELAGDMAWWHVLRRHISYFGDEEGFQGLLSHVGQDDPFFEKLVALAGDFDSERPRQPFKYWHYVDEEFRDLVDKMTNLDPKRRITAREALQHPWFRDTVTVTPLVVLADLRHCIVPIRIQLSPLYPS